MKILRAFVSILFLTLSAQSQEKSLIINKEQPSLLPSEHKPLDVEVFKTIVPGKKSGKAYGVAFFRMENDSLRLFQTFYGTDAKFDVAYYKWENDTTVTIRLYNSKNRKHKTFKVFGSGATTGLIDR